MTKPTNGSTAIANAPAAVSVAPVTLTSGVENTKSATMLHTFVAYVEDLPGVLNRVASLFRRRSYNIESLTVGRTENPGVSRMTIVVEADDDIARRVEANLYKLVNVLRVEDVTYQASVLRDLALIKVQATADNRFQVMQLCDVFRARVVDVTAEALTAEITGSPDKINGLVEVLRPFGILEMVRTGAVAMTRGANHATRTPSRTAMNLAKELSGPTDFGGV